MAKQTRKSAGRRFEAIGASRSTRASRTEWRAPPAGPKHGIEGAAGFAQWRDVATAVFIGSQAGVASQHSGSPGAQRQPAPQGLAEPALGDIFAYAGPAAGWANAIDILRCRVVLRLVTELFDAALERELANGVARRRPRCHMRQIAMYLSHVVLSVPYRTIARAFGRDRTTVVHACAVVEDRRDDLGYDRFVERCERCVNAIFAPFGGPHEER